MSDVLSLNQPQHSAVCVNHSSPSPPLLSPHHRISQHLISDLLSQPHHPAARHSLLEHCVAAPSQGLRRPFHSTLSEVHFRTGPRPFSRTFGEATCNCSCTPLASNTIHPRLSHPSDRCSPHSTPCLPSKSACSDRSLVYDVTGGTHSRAGPSNGKSAPAPSRRENELVTPRPTTPHTEGNAYSCNADAAP